MTWTQDYIPVFNLYVSALLAAAPVIVLLGLLALFRVRAHWAALAGLATAFIVALAVYGMPARLAFAAGVYGALYGLLPISWIVLNAIFIYDLTVRTGKFDIVKQSIAGLSGDRRIHALLIAFSFGAFIEGSAGFGTPVAISAAMLIGLGFNPLQAAGIALIGNTAPVAYGALGTPIIALSQVTGIDIHLLSAMVGRQLPFFSVIVPFWIIWVMAGRRAMLEVWPACLVSGLSFAVVQFVVSNFHGPWLVDIVGSLASLGSTLVLLRFWQPVSVWRFAHEGNGADRPAAPLPAAPVLSRRSVCTAWMPWGILTITVFLWGLPQVKAALNALWETKIDIFYLHQAVFKAPPLVPEPRAENAVYSLNLLSATGTALLIAGIIGGLFLGLKPGEILRTFLGTIYRVRISVLTITAMLALAFVSRYGGLDSTMGLAFASTGVLFPFFSALLGWLGVALTGSDTSSNVLFGNLQTVTAREVGISPVLAAASNSSGGVMGKMIDAQSIVVAGVATRQEGGEGNILRYVFWHSVFLACLVGMLVLLQAYVFPGMIPAGGSIP
ncbi:MAG: L-lactate permease [Opitutaceae bacterium]